MTEDTENPFGDNPGKKYFGESEDGPTGVANLDSKNAVRLRFIEGLSDRPIELADEIQDSIDREADRPIDIPLNRVGTGLFEMHTFTLSFFESAAWILSSWAIEAEVPVVDDFVQYFEEESREDFLDGVSDQDEKIEAVSEYLWEDGTAFDYMDMFYYSGVIEGSFKDLLHSVRMTRNEYVHNPLNFMEIGEVGEVLSLIADCVSAVEQTEELLNEELPVDDAFYDLFGEEQQQ